MKKLVKILPIVMTVMMVFMSTSPVFAEGGKKIGNLTLNPDRSGGGDVVTTSNQILGIIQVIGTIVAVGVIMVLGIKYMMGSAQEKAEYKKTFIPYLIGAVLLFAASTIAGAIGKFAVGI